MTRFLIRRLFNYAILLTLATFLTFALTSVTFHPLDNLLQRNPRPPQSVIDAKAHDLGLDKPLLPRYAHWASGATHGDFGKSVTGQPVSEELGRRVWTSLRLVAIGSILGSIIGVVVVLIKRVDLEHIQLDALPMLLRRDLWAFVRCLATGVKRCRL